ncbi:factor H binding protein domain-containing protein [Ursidibacter arcticus]
MSLMKATLASILLVSLTACSGGGNKGNNAQAEMPESKNMPKVITEEKKDTPKAMPEEKKDTPKVIPEEKKDTPKVMPEEKKDTPKVIPEEKKDAPKVKPEEKKDAPKVMPEEKKPNADEKLSQARKNAEKIASEEKKEALGKDYPQGLTRNPIVKEVLDNMKSYNVGSSIYNQKYSLLKIDYHSNALINNGESNVFNIHKEIGLETNITDLPISGIFSYKGVAIDMKEEGVLNYDIDFSTKKGKGNVTGLAIGNVELQEAEIGHTFDMKSILFGSAKYSSGDGNYNLNLYGPTGEEVLGNMILNDKNNDSSKNYGLAGSRE